ncbi:putative bifunctional diguanylate cyclase/phosphodiesterase [Kineococcus gynurae]|uniref:Bifunctional diguanylate cyclase/phosphodiesterase n=1 Tax=Kineococcus gynurae TaxID=452979 RepID=A0ABV5LV33_9ACTN
MNEDGRDRHGDGVPSSVVDALLRAARVADDPLLVTTVAAHRPAAEARITWSNQAALDLLGPAAGEGAPLARLLPGLDLASLLHPERASRLTASAAGARGERVDTEIVASPGPVPPPLPSLRPAERSWVLRVLPTDEAQRVTGLRVSEERFATLAQGSPVATVVSDVGARLSHVNDAFLTLLGVTAEEVLGTRWLTHVADEDRAGVISAVTDALAGEPAEIEVRMQTRSGALRWTHLRLVPSRSPGHGAGFIATLEDITDRRAREHRLTYQARHDLLTGLPNRLALLERLTELLEVSGRAPGGRSEVAGAAVLLVDLDDFKIVNDGLGPDAGDEVLVELARRLQSCVRAGDLVARPGGDEFVLLCHGVPDLPAVEATVRRVLAAVQAPVDVDGVSLRLDAGVGVVRLATARGCAEEVVRDADIAAHEAKSPAPGRGARPGRWVVVDDEVRARAHHTLRLIADLRRALASATLDVHYQPIVRARDRGDRGDVVSVEALCRWQHPEFGSIDPQVFIQVAERSNLVPAVDGAVLRRALQDLAAWRAAHLRGELPRCPDHVAVNVSALSLVAPGFADAVRAAVAGAGLRPTDLCLEVTETTLAGDLSACRAVLEELRALGVRVAIDDFGTGYSSLAYLRGLPADHLKIDRAFVADLRGPGPDSTTARAVVAAVVALARALDLVVVAEGVETFEQERVLADLGCDLLQGFLYARPQSAAQLRSLLRGPEVLTATAGRGVVRPRTARP